MCICSQWSWSRGMCVHAQFLDVLYTDTIVCICRLANFFGMSIYTDSSLHIQTCRKACICRLKAVYADIRLHMPTSCTDLCKSEQERILLCLVRIRTCCASICACTCNVNCEWPHIVNIIDLGETSSSSISIYTPDTSKYLLNCVIALVLDDTWTGQS